MSAFKSTHKLLMSASVLAIVGLASVAQAQSVPPNTAGPARTPAAPPASTNSGALEEVVVTATRSTSTVNKVALSISAVTEKTLEAQGVQGVSDIARLVPGMTFTSSSSEQNPTITLRGIGGYAALVGSSTTGIYLDDTDLTQRNLAGARTGNGGAFPQLFDLDRVEVLRGPQGTLYGGSSEGGTVRFITPSPSLTQYSGQVRVTGSATYSGSPSGEAALAVGGPIVQDKLGFRISGIDTNQGGWIDAKSVFDGHAFANDVNWQKNGAVRAALKWTPTSTTTITPAIYYSTQYQNAPDVFWLATPQITYPGGTAYNGAPAPELGASYANGACSSTSSPTPKAGACSNTVNGTTYYYAFPNTKIAGFTQAATPWYNGYSIGNGDYTNTASPVFHASPRKTSLLVPTLTLDQDLGAVVVKSITSYTDNTTHGYVYQGLQGSSTFRYISAYMLGPIACPANDPNTQPRSSTGAPSSAGQCYQNALYLPGATDYQDYFFYNQRRRATTEELRLSSAPGGEFGGRFSWVGGFYYSDSQLDEKSSEETNDNLYTQRLRGAPIAWFAGAYGLPYQDTPANSLSPPAAYADISDRVNHVHEREYALFGEANFNITSKLKITAGIRLTDYTQNYQQIYGGYQAGTPPTGTNPYLPVGFAPSAAALQAASRDPTKPNSATNPIVNTATLTPFATNLAGCPTAIDCPLQYTNLNEHEQTASPKLGLSYQLTPTDLLYFTYAKGFRPGGVNPPLPPITCATALAQLGLTASPQTYAQDTVNSYEIGDKSRLFDGRLQVNSSLFYIDWVNMQYTLSGFPAPCGFQLTVNAAHAVSEGAEVQAAGRFGPLSLGLNIGYDHAVFTQAVQNQAGVIYANKGDGLGSPDWSVAANGQYDFHVINMPAFVRLDYTYTGVYQRGPGVGTSTYDSYTYQAPSTQQWNGRASLTAKGVDWSLFVLNITNTHTYQYLTGGATTSGSTNPAVSTATTIRPRTIGVQANYRF